MQRQEPLQPQELGKLCTTCNLPTSLLNEKQIVQVKLAAEADANMWKSVS